MNITGFRIKKDRQSVFLGVVGLLLIGYAVVSGFIYAKSTFFGEALTYKYKIQQSQSQEVVYAENNIFDNTQLGTERGYLTGLTDKIESSFKYKYTSSQKESLNYSSTVIARLVASVPQKDSPNPTEVWARNYTLFSDKNRSAEGGVVSFSEKVSVPYQDYRSELQGLKADLGQSLVGKVKVTHETRVLNLQNSEIDVKESQSFTVSLDDPIFDIQQKGEPKAEGSIKLSSARGQDQYATLWQGSIVLGFVLGVAALAWHFFKQRADGRNRLFKNSYERELARIYRYHDSIIVKTKQPVELKGKDVVELNSFNDLLNIEEQLNLPIIASSVDRGSSLFTISHNNIIYVYRVGRVTVVPKRKTSKRG